MNEFVKLENYLLGWEPWDRRIPLYLDENRPIFHDDGRRFIELEEFLSPLKKQTTYLLEISQVIEEQYLKNLIKRKTKTLETATIFKIIDLFAQLKICESPESCLAQLAAAWFIVAFSQHGGVDDQVAGPRLWKTRHQVINQIMLLFKQLTVQLELILNIKLHLNWDTRHVVFVWIHCIANAGLLSLQTVQKGLRSDVHVSLVLEPDFICRPVCLNIHLRPCRLMQVGSQVFYIGHHYSTIKKATHANKASRHSLTLQNLDFLTRRSSLRLEINWRLLTKFKSCILKAYGLAENLSEEAFAEHLDSIKLNLWQKSKQQEYNRIFFLKYVYVLEGLQSTLGNGFYFTYYFDFRGRIYTDSVIGYTHNRFFRHIYHYGEYSALELATYEERLTPAHYPYVEMVLQKSNLRNLWPQIDFTRKLNLYYIYIIFFELGKLFKSKFISQYKGRLEEKDFIEIGIEVFLYFSDWKLALDEQVEILAILDIFEDIAQQKYLKIPIFKDATASAIQILMLLLGSSTLEHYKICNLTEPCAWYDTYYYIIADFFTKHPAPSPDVLKYFTRSTLKKTIMTFNYEATYSTCWKDFRANANLPWDTEGRVYKHSEILFKQFYKYLTDIFDTKVFFLRPSEEILQVFKKEWADNKRFFFITSDEFIIYYDYYKIIKHRIDRIINNNRESIQWNVQTQEADTQKMFRALRANLIHSFDGLIVRQVTLELNYPIMTIHDSFGIDILAIPRLQEIAMNELQKIFDTDFFGLSEGKAPILIKSRFTFV